MIYSQDDRVFMRSLATRGRAGGLSPRPSVPGRAATSSVRQAAGGFDVILVETVGIGQEAMPFRPGSVDRTVFVMSPDYGSRLQLQKIVDARRGGHGRRQQVRPGRRAHRLEEVEQRLDERARPAAADATVAKRHRDRASISCSGF